MIGHTVQIYQEYIAWCENNGEKTFASAILGKKFSQIGIDRTRLQNNGKREYHYILNCSKIVAKFHESGLGDMEEFSDTSQADMFHNETADIPIFNVPEIISQKIILTLLEKNIPPPNTSKDKKADKQGGGIQDLFDYVTEDTRAPVASSSKTAEISKVIELPEPIIDNPRTNKLPDSKPINEVSSAILPIRAQREERLRKWAIDYGEDLDVFVTITEKDVRVFHEYRDRMMSDAVIPLTNMFESRPGFMRLLLLQHKSSLSPCEGEKEVSYK